MEDNPNLETGEIPLTPPIPIPTEWNPLIVGLSAEAEMAGRAAWSLAISKCYSDIGSVKKDGENKYHHYKYATAEAIFSAAKAALAKNGISIFPIMGDIHESDIKTQDNKDQTYTRMSFRFVIIEATTGYTVVVPWVADSIDNLDKGINKCLTVALKSFIRILFAVSEGGDDSDGEETAPIAEGHRPRQETRGRGRQEPQPEPEPTKPKERTPEQVHADKLLKEALPGLTSEDDREKSEAKFVADNLKAAAESFGMKVSDAILLIAGGKEKITRADVQEGTISIEKATALEEELRDAKDRKGIQKQVLYYSALEGYTTADSFLSEFEPAYAERLATETKAYSSTELHEAAKEILLDQRLAQ